MNKFLYTLIALALVSILSLGGYYLYSRNKQTAPTPAEVTKKVTPTPPTISQRSEVTDESNIGSCDRLKGQAVVSRIEIAEFNGNRTVVGTMNGKISNLVVGSGQAELDLVAQGSTTGEHILVKEKAGMVEDANGKDIGIGGLANGIEASAQFNCFPKKDSDNILITRITVNKL